MLLTFLNQYHSEEAVRKMSQDEPLTDSDRWNWLSKLREAAANLIRQGAPGVVLSCSALKRKYRDVLRAVRLREDLVLQFLYLQVSQHLLEERVRTRSNHYMKAAMVQSQLQSLENPDADELDVLIITADDEVSTVHQTARNAVQREVRNGRS